MKEKRKVALTKRSVTKGPGYGCVPDLPDHRDILYSMVRKVPAVLPPFIPYYAHQGESEEGRIDCSNASCITHSFIV